MSVETLASGYALAEAPRWSPEASLYFSDVAGGGVYRAEARGAVSLVIPRRRRVGGIALHADGGIVVTGRDVSHVRDGETRTLLRREGVTFNDLCCDAAGRIYVGAVRADPTDPERTLGETLCIAREGEAWLVYGDMPIPNGIAFAPDGARLYQAESAWRRVHALDLDASGGVRARRVLVDLSGGHGPDFAFPPRHVGVDGLAVDEQGGVWVALFGAGRVQRYTAEGQADLAIEIPARRVTSLAFGGADRRDLYVTSADDGDDPGLRGCVFRTRCPVAGLPVPIARV